MSWPHILSFSRVIAGPIVAALVLAAPGDSYLIAAGIFGIATLTDLIDGKLARHSQRVSSLGIFLDTTADKVMVGVALVAMSIAGLAQAWIPLVIVGRELLISGLRSYAASRDQIIPARIWGKGKAAVTMLAIFCVLVAADGTAGGIMYHFASHATWNNIRTGSSWLLGLGGALTVISGAAYIIDARSLFRSSDAAADEPRRVAAGGKR